MQRPSTYPTALTTAVLAAVLTTASCGAGSTAAGPAPSSPRTPASSAASSPAPPPASPGASVSPVPPASPAAKASRGPTLSLPPDPPPGCDDQPWQTTPAHVTRHFATPPVPVITAIRTGTHPECGYDRIVFNFRGPTPGYDIWYVSKVVAGASGKSVSVPGQRYLLITIHPAQGHAGSGASTIARLSASTGYPMLKGYAVTGDFDGVLSVVVGLAKATAFRVGRLSGRLYVDVAG
jgi:hypothetical protein